MSKRILVATYAHADRLLAGARTARDENLKIVDAYCPYAVHGLAEAMGLRPSRLTWVCFAFGAFGVFFMTWFQFWTSAESWPLNIGGKPWNSLPAFGPAIFESMVLCAGLGTVAILFLVAKLRPGRAPRLVVDRVTDDRFALVVEHETARLDPAEVRLLLAASDSVTLEERVLDDPPRHDSGVHDPSARAGARSWLGPINGTLAAILLVLAVVIVWGPRNFSRPNWEVFREMFRSPASSALSHNAVLPGGITLQNPVPGTIPRGALPLHYAATEQDAIRAGKELKNPYAPRDGAPVDPAILERGRVVFMRFCACCHGPNGGGDGPVSRRGFPPPPAYATGKSNEMADGQIFHIITYGQKNMPPYGPLVARQDRWKVILYVRHLQVKGKQAAAKAAELQKQSGGKPAVGGETPQADEKPTTAPAAAKQQPKPAVEAKPEPSKTRSASTKGTIRPKRTAAESGDRKP